ncbi:MAG: hypothetical protein Q9195_007472 [Heterodermia aff. obscurata]
MAPLPPPSHVRTPKRRKIASVDPQETAPSAFKPSTPSESLPTTQPSVPFSTRAFRAVKDAVLGTSTSGGSAGGGETIGSLRKSLSTLELWKLARLQNGSTRGMGVSESAAKRKREREDDTGKEGSLSKNEAIVREVGQSGETGKEALRKEQDSEKEVGGGTSSKKGAKVNGTGSTRKRKTYRSKVPESAPGEENNNEDQLQGATPQSSKRIARIRKGELPEAVESSPQRSASDRTPRKQRRKISNGSVSSGKEEVRVPHSEETELGFKAMGALKLLQDGLQEKESSNAESDTNISETQMNNTGTPLQKSDRPLKVMSNGSISEAQPILQADDALNDLESPAPMEEAVKTLQKALMDAAPEDLGSFKSNILSGLTGKRRLPLVNLESEYQKVHQLVEQTVLAGEGNSMLLIGSRGCAKSTLVETVVSDLSIENGENFHVVRLNGFIHTDDKVALREIWRQLGREMEVEDDATTGRSNYADTLSSLLALLSHSAEEEPNTENPNVAKSVVFILDEFDLFASHPRQTLLYNLFDIAQSRNAPIAVLGLTTKIDVVESLEKRVKSRFGQRYVHLSLPRTFAAFTLICKAALAPGRRFPLHTHDREINGHGGTAAVQKLGTTWSTYVDSLFRHPTFLTHLRSIYATTKSVPTFFSSCLYLISALSPSNVPNPQSFLSSSTSLRPPDSKLHLLPSLSEVGLSLLIAAARLDIILSTDLCNFEMAYEEYVTLASRVRMQTSASGQLAIGGGGGRIWDKAVGKREWERLVALELVLPATGGSTAAKGRGEQGRMWRVDVGLEEIGGSVKMGAVLARWCREI